MGTADIQQILNFLPFVERTPDSALWMTFDREADVLYINFKKGVEATDSELTDDDVIVRYRDNEVIGFTVLHATHRTMRAN